MTSSTLQWLPSKRDPLTGHFTSHSVGCRQMVVSCPIFLFLLPLVGIHDGERYHRYPVRLVVSFFGRGLFCFSRGRFVVVFVFVVFGQYFIAGTFLFRVIGVLLFTGGGGPYFARMCNVVARGEDWATGFNFVCIPT